jgi:hypothetical protein
MPTVMPWPRPAKLDIDLRTADEERSRRTCWPGMIASPTSAFR